MRYFVTPLLATVLIVGCEAEKSTQKQTATSAGTAKTATAEKSLAGDKVVNSYIPDYPELYCEELVKLKLRSDVSDELRYFCEDGKPTVDMIEMRERLMNINGELEMRVLQEKHNNEEEISEFIVAWGYYVKIRPFEVNGKPLYEFITKNIKDDDTSLETKSERLPDGKLDSGLHLWSVNMNYDLKIKATNGLSLDSIRNTQYNMYQVQSGNEEMGLGVEHMVDTDNPDYQRSVMINMSFNDGTGYNDGVGGTVVMNYLHIVIKNRGFPKTARKAIDEIAQFLANEMYNGIQK